MAIESGFFNSVNGDRKYNARDVSRYFENILSSGIFKRVTDCLKVTADGGMVLNVAPGSGLIDSQWFRVITTENVTIPTANAALPRIDNVVARLDFSDAVRAVVLDVVAGTPAASPVAPEPVRTTMQHEIVLARVAVGAAVTAVTDANITDTREDDALCGYVQSLVDTPILKAIHSTFTAPTNNTTSVPINVPGFTADVDLVNVFANGFRLVPQKEYTVAGTTITLANGVAVGTVVDVEVLKPVMPDSVPTATETVAALVQDITSVHDRLAALEADSGWIELPWENGTSSNPNWTARLRRVGKSIFLRGLCTGITANELQVCTIPEGFRPTMGGHAYAGFCSTNAGSNTRAARMFINTDGGVVFRSAGSAAPASTDVVTISTSWLID